MRHGDGWHVEKPKVFVPHYRCQLSSGFGIKSCQCGPCILLMEYRQCFAVARNRRVIEWCYKSAERLSARGILCTQLPNREFGRPVRLSFANLNELVRARDEDRVLAGWFGQARLGSIRILHIHLELAQLGCKDD